MPQPICLGGLWAGDSGGQPELQLRQPPSDLLDPSQYSLSGIWRHTLLPKMVMQILERGRILGLPDTLRTRGLVVVHVDGVSFSPSVANGSLPSLVVRRGGAEVRPLCKLPCGWGWHGTGTTLPATCLKLVTPHAGDVAPNLVWGTSGTRVLGFADAGSFQPVVAALLLAGGSRRRRCGTLSGAPGPDPGSLLRSRTVEDQLAKIHVPRLVDPPPACVFFGGLELLVLRLPLRRPLRQPGWAAALPGRTGCDVLGEL